MIRIQGNTGSADAIRNLNRSFLSLYKRLEKLSSGRRINSAADDPAGLVISEQMRAQIASLNKQIENHSNQINKYNAADGAVDQLRSKLVHLRELAVAAANEGYNSEEQQKVLDDEAQRIVESYNRQLQGAVFNGTPLLNGQEGAVADIAPLDALNLKDADKAEETISRIDSALRNIDRVQGELGATQKYDLEATRSNMEITVQNLTAAHAQILDTDYAREIAGLVRDLIKVKAGQAVLAHSFLSNKLVDDLLK